MFETYWTWTSNIITYCTLRNEHNWEDLCIQLRNKHAILNTKTESGGIRFSNPFFCWWFITDLLMQHKFQCVNLNSRSWRARQANPITPTHLMQKHHCAGLVCLEWTKAYQLWFGMYPWWTQTKQETKSKGVMALDTLLLFFLHLLTSVSNSPWGFTRETALSFFYPLLA